jgi:glycosyltransferase involved in cell wall biosynthesis
MIKASVIIPTFNRAEYLGQAIESVLSQTLQDFEIIVVDDGSTDNTREVALSYKDTRVNYVHKDNGGVSSARNTGIKTSRGEYIALLDSDDIWLPDNLERKVKILDSHPDIGLVCSDAYFLDNKTGMNTGTLWSEKRFKYSQNPENAARQPMKDLLWRSCFIMPQATIIRNSVFTTVGYFDESLPTSEDWDFFVRVVQRFPIEIINAPLLKIRRHSASLSKNLDKVYQGSVISINKAIRSDSFSGEELSILKKRLALEHCRYGRWALINNRGSAAKKALLSSIRTNPWDIRAYAYLVLSLFGNRTFLSFRSWKKTFKHIVSHQSPKKTESAANQ